MAENMDNMRRILELAESEIVDEAVGVAVVDRMANAMLDSKPLNQIAKRVIDDDQMDMFKGMIMEPLRALIAKALDASGATVSGGVLSKASREMKGAARGDMGAE